VQGDGEWELQSVHNVLPLPLLPTHALPLFQRGDPPTGDSPLGTAPVSIHAMVCSSSGTTPAWILATVCSHSEIDCFCMRSCGLQLPSGHIHLLWHGVPPGPQVDICSTVGLYGLRGTTCVTTVFSMGCRGISALARGGPPLPVSFFSDLVCRVVLLTFFSISFSDSCCTVFFTLS